MKAFCIVEIMYNFEEMLLCQLSAAVRAEPETALLCFSKNKHDVENDTKVNAVREFFLLVLAGWRNCCIDCKVIKCTKC